MVESGSAEAAIREAGGKGKGLMRDPVSHMRYVDFHPEEEELVKLQNYDSES